MAPLVVGRAELAQAEWRRPGVVAAVQVLEHGHPGLGGGPEAVAIQQLALQVANKPSATALSNQSPTDPIEAVMAASRQRRPNLSQVDWQP